MRNVSIFSVKMFTACILTGMSLVVFADPSIGRVNFAINCKLESQQQFDRAMAQFHSMMYAQSLESFKKISVEDSKCGMSYYGQALSLIHPLWEDPPSDETLKQGGELLKTALANTNGPRMQGFIKALQAYYADPQGTPESKRLLRWEKAQFELLKKNPSDFEALALYALTHIATADNRDRTFKHQREAATLLEKLRAKNPEHPAGSLYALYAYNNQVLAPKGLEIARNYAKIAAELPHALNASAQIFVRLGLWQEVISTSIRSANAAKNQKLPDGALPMHYAQAMDFLIYSYLQQGQTVKAKEVLDELNSVQKIQATFPAAYEIASANARFYLEQQLWNEAQQLVINKPEGFPWKQFPAAMALIHYTRGLGAAFSNNKQLVMQSIVDLNDDYSQLVVANQRYWGVLTLAKRNVLRAWVENLEGRQDSALSVMKAAADLENSVDKYPITPSEIMPSRELYGQMLLANKKFDQALVAFEQSLVISPNRLQSIYGAAVAAEQLKDRVLAKRYYRRFVENTVQHDGQIPGLDHAKKFLEAAPIVKN